MSEKLQKRSINSLAETRAIDPNVLQRQAASPVDSIWVGASAGSGKTKVLTDRVLRLLLPRGEHEPGTKPHKILCLTFTKAGANEMALRLSRRLSVWAVEPEERLIEELQSLLGKAPAPYEIAAARRLFTQVIDAPGGLHILTIHAFCQSVLGRFPLEAGLPPHFELLEDAQAAEMLRAAYMHVLRSAEAGSPLQQAIDALAGEVNEDQLFALVRDMSKERSQMGKIFKTYWDENGVYAALCEALSIPAGHFPEKILLQQSENGAFDHSGVLRAAHALAKGSDTDKSRAQTLYSWVEVPVSRRPALWEDYRSVFLTADGEIRSRLATKAAVTAMPDILEVMGVEAARLVALQDTMDRASCALLTRELLTLGKAVLSGYEALKTQRGALDFDDLIVKTLALLQSQAAWVLFKLDQGLDHILIDEAQDTNPEQWQIIAALCEEFYTGRGAKDEVLRTIFTVGDIKQSIYSFQRAAPREFTRMQAYFEQKISESGQNFAEIPMNISFRTTKPVLQAVDSVFSLPEASQGMGHIPVEHFSYREGQAGLVEIHPLFTTPEIEKADPWTPPVEIVESDSGASQLAAHIAETISVWLTTKEILPSRNRPIEAGDVLILVRTRTTFFQQLVRALKDKKIPVSGVDRMVLRDQMAVQDLVAAAQFALLPEDDLTLACLLKSPLIGLDEDELMKLAAYRAENSSLWEAVKAQTGAIADYLQGLLDAGMMNPHAFFSRLLFLPCPANAHSGMQAMRGRLGDDAQDPLDELLNAALVYETTHIPSLQGFVQWHVQGESDIKREMEESAGKVRIMTVHGAKGLQAPIVFLPDTTRTSRQSPARAEGRLLWPEKTGLAVPLWAPRKDGESTFFAGHAGALQARLDEEYRRLLYVAMTRAEDRLYVFGSEGKKASLTDSWYHFIMAGLSALPDADVQENGAVRLSLPQVKPPDRQKETPKTTPQIEKPPSWMHIRAPIEEMQRAKRPSGLEPAVFSPLSEADTYRFLRGNLTHKLLQFLPTLAEETRAKAALKFMDQNGQELKIEQKQSVIDEVLAIFSQKEWAPLFGKSSQAEVPISGILPDGRLINGQIDRLLVTPQAVYIIDYKTNRPPPLAEKDIPLIYREQMQAYADTLKAIYPGRSIHAALLWTDGPRLMPVTLA